MFCLTAHRRGSSLQHSFLCVVTYECQTSRIGLLSLMYESFMSTLRNSRDVSEERLDAKDEDIMCAVASYVQSTILHRQTVISVRVGTPLSLLWKYSLFDGALCAALCIL